MGVGYRALSRSNWVNSFFYILFPFLLQIPKVHVRVYNKCNRAYQLQNFTASTPQADLQ